MIVRELGGWIGGGRLRRLRRISHIRRIRLMDAGIKKGLEREAPAREGILF